MKPLFITVISTVCSISTGTVSAQKAPATVTHNDDFISSLLETVTYDNFLPLHYASTRKPVKTGVQAITFVNAGNKFTFYKSKYNTFIKSFEVIQADKSIGNLLPIGTPKTEVLAKLKVAKSADILKVSDLEGGANTTLYFKDGKLQKMSFYAIVD